MAQTNLARQYALALLSLNENALHQVYRDFQVMAGFWSKQLNDVIRFLEHPSIEEQYKIALLKPLKDHLSPTTLALLHLLVNQGKIKLLKSIVQQFQRLYQAIHVYVSTPLPLTEEQRRKLEKAVRRDPQIFEQQNRRIEFHYEQENIECDPWAKEIIKQLLYRQIELLEQL